MSIAALAASEAEMQSLLSDSDRNVQVTAHTARISSIAHAISEAAIANQPLNNSLSEAVVIRAPTPPPNALDIQERIAEDEQLARQIGQAELEHVRIESLQQKLLHIGCLFFVIAIGCFTGAALSSLSSLLLPIGWSFAGLFFGIFLASLLLDLRPSGIGPIQYEIDTTLNQDNFKKPLFPTVPPLPIGTSPDRYQKLTELCPTIMAGDPDAAEVLSNIRDKWVHRMNTKQGFVMVPRDVQARQRWYENLIFYANHLTYMLENPAIDTETKKLWLRGLSEASPHCGTRWEMTIKNIVYGHHTNRSVTDIPDWTQMKNEELRQGTIEALCESSPHSVKHFTQQVNKVIHIPEAGRNPEEDPFHDSTYYQAKFFSRYNSKAIVNHFMALVNGIRIKKDGVWERQGVAVERDQLFDWFRGKGKDGEEIMHDDDDGASNPSFIAGDFKREAIAFLLIDLGILSSQV